MAIKKIKIGNTSYDVNDARVVSDAIAYLGLEVGDSFSVTVNEGLPAGYEELDYIIASGASWFSTGITPNLNTKIEIKWRRASSGSFYLAGVTNSNNTASVTEYMTSSSGNWRFGNRYLSFTWSLNTDYVTVHTSSGVISNGTILSTYSTVSSFTSPGPLYLCAVNANGDGIPTSNLFDGRIYYCKIWNGEELVADFVPAKDTTNNKVGMYDRKRSAFYSSESSTDFTAPASS